MGISIVLLSYMEAENLKILLPQIIDNVKKTKESYEIFVIDTVEPLDNSSEICEEFGAKYINQEEPGFAGAFRTGIKYASMDKFLIMDSDGSHNPIYIPDIYNKFVNNNCDLVIGSRYVKGGHTSDSKSSIVMSKILNTVFRICLGIKASDISTDFRMYHTAQLQAITLKCKNYDVLQEVLLKLKMNRTDFKVDEVPISFDKRMYGESKRKLIPFIISYIKTLFRLVGIRLTTSATFKNIFLYGIFGASAALLEYGVFAFLISHSNIYPELVNILGALCGFTFSFSTNTFLNFRKTDNLFARFSSYGLICLIGMVFSTLIISLLKNSMNLLLLKALCMVVVSIVQFIANKKITYRN